MDFGQRVDAKSVGGLLVALHDAIDIYEQREIVLDFSGADRAYLDAMVPIICVLEARREAGIEFAITLPSDQKLSRLFVNTNWAHFLPS